MGRYGYAEQKKILKASTKTELTKALKHYNKFGYLQNSEVKYFEYDRKPYQVLIVKSWVVQKGS